MNEAKETTFSIDQCISAIRGISSHSVTKVNDGQDSQCDILQMCYAVTSLFEDIPHYMMN